MEERVGKKNGIMMKNVKRFPHNIHTACTAATSQKSEEGEFEKIITFPFDVLHGLLYEY